MRVRLRHQRMRSRRALLWAGVVFVAAQLVAGLWLDRYGLRLRFPEAVQTLAAVHARPTTPDVVILGSSRTGNAICQDLSAAWVSRINDSAVTVFNGSVPAGDL